MTWRDVTTDLTEWGQPVAPIQLNQHFSYLSSMSAVICISFQPATMTQLNLQQSNKIAVKALVTL